MFSKNNPQYFEHNPHIKVTTSDGRIYTRILYFHLRWDHITKFEFVNCTNLHITETFMSWFTEQFLRSVRTDEFMFQVSMSTAPTDLQDRLTKLQGTN